MIPVPEIPALRSRLVWMAEDARNSRRPIAELISRWVQRLDAGWALFRDLTGREPAKFEVHEPLPVIAAVPGSEYCGSG